MVLLVSLNEIITIKPISSFVELMKKQKRCKMIFLVAKLDITMQALSETVLKNVLCSYWMETFAE
jgi:predicted transcriptional regulator